MRAENTRGVDWSYLLKLFAAITSPATCSQRACRSGVGVGCEEELMDAAEQAQRALHGLQFTNMSTEMQRVAAAAGRDGAGFGGQGGRPRAAGADARLSLRQQTTSNQ